MDKNSLYLAKEVEIPETLSLTTTKYYFASPNQAKSALALAKLFCVIPHYCKPITNEEWNDDTIEKVAIIRIGNEILTEYMRRGYSFLAFRTIEQAQRFLKSNIELIKQYYML